MSDVTEPGARPEASRATAPAVSNQKVIWAVTFVWREPVVRRASTPPRLATTTVAAKATAHSPSRTIVSIYALSLTRLSHPTGIGSRLTEPERAGTLTHSAPGDDGTYRAGLAGRLGQGHS